MTRKPRQHLYLIHDYLCTIRSSESLWWVSRTMTKQTQARSWSWLLVSVYGCCRLRRLVTPAITPSQRAQLMLLMTNGEGILLLMTTSIILIYIQMLLGATQSQQSEWFLVSINISCCWHCTNAFRILFKSCICIDWHHALCYDCSNVNSVNIAQAKVPCPLHSVRLPDTITNVNISQYNRNNTEKLV